MQRGQMGTKELQMEIRRELAQLGWSIRRLAEIIEAQSEDAGSIKDVMKVTERVKKQLKRPSTSSERLKYYLTLIHNHQEYQEELARRPVQFRNDVIDDQLGQFIEHRSKRRLRSIKKRLKTDLP